MMGQYCHHPFLIKVKHREGPAVILKHLPQRAPRRTLPICPRKDLKAIRLLSEKDSTATTHIKESICAANKVGLHTHLNIGNKRVPPNHPSTPKKPANLPQILQQTKVSRKGNRAGQIYGSCLPPHRLPECIRICRSCPTVERREICFSRSARRYVIKKILMRIDLQGMDPKPNCSNGDLASHQ